MKRKPDNVILMPGAGQEHHDSQNRAARRRRRNTVGAVAGGFALIAASVGVGVWSYNSIQNEKPSFILDGTVENDGQPFEVTGGVFLGCGSWGTDKAVITARIRTVVDVPTDNLDPKGRVVQVQTTTGDRFCEDALRTIKVRPELLVPGLIEDVTGWEENIVGDGTYSAGENFKHQIEKAQAAGIPTYPIAQ